MFDGCLVNSSVIFSQMTSMGFMDAGFDVVNLFPANETAPQQEVILEILANIAPQHVKQIKTLDMLTLQIPHYHKGRFLTVPWHQIDGWNLNIRVFIVNYPFFHYFQCQK